MRNRFQSCASSYDLAKSLRDVTVRDLGRVAQPELPPQLEGCDHLRPRSAAPRRRRRPIAGVEFIAVCDARDISDDKAAALVFQARDLKKLGEEKEPDADYLKELQEQGADRPPVTRARPRCRLSPSRSASRRASGRTSCLP